MTSQKDVDDFNLERRIAERKQESMTQYTVSLTVVVEGDDLDEAMQQAREDIAHHARRGTLNVTTDAGDRFDLEPDGTRYELYRAAANLEAVVRFLQAEKRNEHFTLTTDGVTAATLDSVLESAAQMPPDADLTPLSQADNELLELLRHTYGPATLVSDLLDSEG